MEHNVGKIDSRIRWILAAVFFAISLGFNGNPAIGLLAAVVALVLVATALTRACPLYHLFGLKTCPRNPAARPG